MKTMYKLTMIAGLLKPARRNPELAACAIAGLLFLAAVSAPAKAQGTNTYTGMTVVHGGTIGMVPGQKVSITVPNFYLQDGSVIRFLKHTIKVHAVTENESNLVYSGESGALGEHEWGHVMDVGPANFAVPGEPRTGRYEVWIEIESFPPTTEVRNAEVLAPTFELIDELRGNTVIFGMLLPAIQKVRDKNGI